jgi:DNA-binding PadR family transcriptional regulator
MTEFTDTEFLELFFDSGRVEYNIYDVQRSVSHFGFSVHRPDCGTDVTQRSYTLSFFERLKAAAVPWSSSITDYLLRLLWIREVKFEMEPPIKNDIFSLITRAFALNDAAKTSIETIKKGFDALLQGKYLDEIEVPNQIPDVTFENSWVKVYSLTPKGKRYAKKMILTKKEFFVSVESSPTSVKEDSQVVELLKKQNNLIEKGTAVNKKGFDSLKQKSHQSLAELVKTLPLLQQEREDENWVSLSTAETLTGEDKENLKKQRQRGANVLYEGLEYGKDTEGRIWCQPSKRKVFYLKKYLSGHNFSR